MNNPISSTPAANSNEQASVSTREHLQSAAEHLQSAARKAAGSIPNANQAASQALKDGYAELKPDLAAARREAGEAGETLAAEAGQKWEALLKDGRSALERSEQFVRDRPLASVGIAVAAGYVLSRLLSHR